MRNATTERNIQMQNKILVFQGNYIRTLGVPLVILTGYSTVTGHLASEYFIFIRHFRDFFRLRRFRYKYDTPAPHNVEYDVEGMMGLAFQEAQQVLNDFVTDRYNQFGLDARIEISFNQVNESILTFIFLFRDQQDQIAQLRQDADSPYLRSLFQRWDQLPRLIED